MKSAAKTQLLIQYDIVRYRMERPKVNAAKEKVAANNVTNGNWNQRASRWEVFFNTPLRGVETLTHSLPKQWRICRALVCALAHTL